MHDASCPQDARHHQPGVDLQEALKTEGRAHSKALRGRRSKRAAKTGKALARRHRRIANRRKDRDHQITARLVRAHKLIATEDLAPSNMTALAKGTADKPGRNVKETAPSEPRSGLMAVGHKDRMKATPAVLPANPRACSRAVLREDHGRALDRTQFAR
jgi:transposase